jgi:hypothetical protein
MIRMVTISSWMRHTTRYGPTRYFQKSPRGPERDSTILAGIVEESNPLLH